MEKQIPIYFDSVVVSSPFQPISESTPNLGRLKVRVFTKYANRNGSYITDAVAQQLIDSATTGNVPVVGFFDHSTEAWASHSGPTLANGYGYVEKFEGWQPFQDSDGETRDYAVFSVVLFTDYFEEAKKVGGMAQSMELNPASISGDWVQLGDQEFFCYTTAKMLGFCVIGEHEPCFSASAFFSKNDEEYETQYDKFASLLSDLKVRVEEAEKEQGGEGTMEDKNIVETQAPENFEAAESISAPADVIPTAHCVTQDTYDALQSKFDELQAQFEAAQAQISELTAQKDELSARYDELAAQNTTFAEKVNELTQAIETLNGEKSELTQSIQNYEVMAKKMEDEHKLSLIAQYANLIDEEELNSIQSQLDTFSYDELDSKLALMYAHKEMEKKESPAKVFVPEAPVSQFALLMEKYKK